MASESLKHGHKFFDRTTKIIPGKPQLQEVVNSKTGKMEMMLVVTNREIIYIEHNVSALSRMMMDAGKKARLATGMTTEKSQADFMATQAEEIADPKTVDAELEEYFSMLGMNKPLPQPTSTSSDAVDQGRNDAVSVNFGRFADESLPGFD